MSYLQKYVRQVKPRNESYIPHIEKIHNFLIEGEMNPKELAKYGGKRARVLQKAIEDGTPLETDEGEFPLTWIDDSDKQKFVSAIGGEASDFGSSLKSGPRFKKVFKNEKGDEFTIKQLVKSAMFGGRGGSGEPTGADWEDIITHHYNLLIGNPGHDPNATKAAEDKWDDFDIIGEKIAQNFIKEIGKSGMTQYGAGKSKSNLSNFWQNPAEGISGGTDGTPKTDMYNKQYQVSLKKAGGSQLASGSKGETMATFYAALQHFSLSKEGGVVMNKIMKAIEDNFTKLTTAKTKDELEVISKDKRKSRHLSDKDQTALTGYITTDEFHKKFNKEMLPELNDIPKAKEFKEWFVFEAMSGYSKFKEPLAVSSVCMEFSADNGNITKFIEVTKGGTVAGLKGTPTISGGITKISGKVKFYAAWKSGGGNPYSVLRVAGDGKDFEYDDTTLIGCIRKTIYEDKIAQAFLIEETNQLDEFKFIGKTFDRLKSMGKNAILWAKNLIAKIMKAVKNALNRIKKMGKKMFEGAIKFLGIKPDVKASLPSDLNGFVYGMSD